MSERSFPPLPCMCATLRRASRALSQHYDEAMRPLGLTITQFTLLQALSITGEVSQGKLGEILAMDSTTLTRTLRTMNGPGNGRGKKHRWIEIRPGSDRRERKLSLSPAGSAELNRVTPHWQRAQARLRTRLGKQRWNNLRNLVNDATNVVAI